MIQNKLKIFIKLAREGKVSDIIRAFVRYILLFQKYRFVELNLDAFHSKPYKARIPLDYRLATFEDMADIFHNWPDSQEEYERHHEVYYKWGFQTCFLFFHKETDEIVHLQFLLTSDDILNIKRFLPLQIYGCLASNQRAFVEWMYTFEKHRLRGIAIEAMEQARNQLIENPTEEMLNEITKQLKGNLTKVVMASYIKLKRNQEDGIQEEEWSKIFWLQRF